ncbi:methyltransferase domain-containing protein [Roseiconus nitratireducens]|uniref:Methyltransferase domain-containing protein n=1 Tax=Roseiconus nitratireducens TaxID=2605748 RepID=A0A5M6CW29_9BACT|nr:methyltransferase domain-containing protein [Roseiconus nitratireducens]KAA5539438.1 methyltransferase domain-containing protein [Roseiconus nitratireducens]
MFPLQCTVRRCCELLQLKESSLVCAAGHHFDRAKGGYWNLLQPQDRKSRDPGDPEEAVMARHRWLQRGHMEGLVESLLPWVAAGTNSDGDAPPVTLDLGCGEGSFGEALFAEQASGFCGIDLSKRAIKLAARRWPEATWVLANADRTLPAADGSVDRLLSLFGRRPVVEMARVLAPAGRCVVAVPAENDLIELREQVQQAGHRRSRWQRVVESMAEVNLEFIEHKNWHHRVRLVPDAIQDALAMTYRGQRHSQQSRMRFEDPVDVTLAADLLCFQRPS